MDQEKVVAVLRGKLTAKLKVGLLIVLASLLVGNDFDCATLSSWSLVALKWFLKRLVCCGDDLMNGELD